MKSLLRITHPEIAWHTASMMLHVFGAAALLSFIVSMHWYLWLPDILCLTICFYSGYYFELGFRTRRFQEFRYGAPEPNENEIDKNGNRRCRWCNKIFRPLYNGDLFCTVKCSADSGLADEKERTR